MSARTFIFGLILLLQLSCTDDAADIAAFRDDSSITSLNGTWKVVSFEDYTENTVEYKTDENSKDLDIVVTFNDTRTPHELSGKNTTNTIAGEFAYIGIRKFRIHELFSTQVAQPVWADKFLEAVLEEELEYKINRMALRVFYEGTTKSVTLKRE